MDIIEQSKKKKKLPWYKNIFSKEAKESLDLGLEKKERKIKKIKSKKKKQEEVPKNIFDKLCIWRAIFKACFHAFLFAVVIAFFVVLYYLSYEHSSK